MTETVAAQRHTVSADGFVNPLNLPANAEADSHVKVYGDDELLQQGVDYTLEGVGDTGDLDEIAGVNAILEPEVLLEGFSTYTIVHEPPLDQETSLASGGTLGRIYEGGLDALTRRVQALGSRVDRTTHIPVDADVSVTLPHPEPRRGLVWDETGTRLVNTTKDPDTEPLTSAAEILVQCAAILLQVQGVRDETTVARDAAQAAQGAAEAAAAAAGDPEAIAAMGAPVGTTLLFAHTNIPLDAVLKENGAVVSQAAYPFLYAAIGDSYNTGGEGAGNFRLPDSRAEFLRFWDDGRGIDSGRSLFSAQAEMVGAHDHTATVSSAGAHTHTYSAEARRGLNGAFTTTFRPSNGDSAEPNTSPTLTTTSAGGHSHIVTVNVNSGTENRPRNVVRLACIKYAQYEPPELP